MTEPCRVLAEMTVSWCRGQVAQLMRGGGGGGMCDAKSLLGAQMAGGMIPRADAGYKVAVAPGRWQGRDAEVVQGGRDRWHN